MSYGAAAAGAGPPGNEAVVRAAMTAWRLDAETAAVLEHGDLRALLAEGDPAVLGAGLELWDPEVDFRVQIAATEGACHGHAGLVRFLVDTLEAFDRFVPDVEMEAVGDQVLWWGTIHARGRGSGVVMDVATAALVDVREGRIVHFENFGTREQALAAAESS